MCEEPVSSQDEQTSPTLRRIVGEIVTTAVYEELLAEIDDPDLQDQ